MGKYIGQSQVVLRPSSTQQLSEVMAHCNNRKLAVVPQVSISNMHDINTLAWAAFDKC